jgi:transposase
MRAMGMLKRHDYSDEQRDRAVRSVLEGGKSIAEVGRELGIRYETLRRWVRASEGEAGVTMVDAVTRAERPADDAELSGEVGDEGKPRTLPERAPAADVGARLSELERENRELRRANEVLRSASAMLAGELARSQG